jgi:hypothetical protein
VRYLAIGPKQGMLNSAVTVTDPSQPEAHWVIDELEAFLTMSAHDRCMFTDIPENRFTPYKFMNHLRTVIERTDPQHGAAYLEGPDAATKQSILTKLDTWGSAFTADTPLPRAEANGALLLASAKFYNHPTGEFNELDPEVPPDWPGIGDELGGDPYPA